MSELLEPFDESIEVATYQNMNSKIARDNRQKDIQDLERITALPEEKQKQYKMGVVIADLEKLKAMTDEEYLQNHLYSEKDKKRGYSLTRYNPQSQWDWWRIGGRWDGAMTGVPHETDNGFNFGEECEELENNSCKVKDIKSDFVPFAIVTPDGEWHEQGKMGWWAIVTDEEENWDEETKALFATYPENIAVLCDLHI